MNPEALNKTEVVTFTGLQKWCEAIIAELKELAAKASPEDKAAIGTLIDEINNEKIQMEVEASTMADTDPDFREVKNRLVEDCENKLGAIASVSAQEVFTAAERRANKLP